MAYTSSASGPDATAQKTPLLARRTPAAATLPKLSIEIPRSAFMPNATGLPQGRGQFHKNTTSQPAPIQTPQTDASLPTTPRSPRYTRRQEQEWWTQCIEHADEQDWDDYFFQPQDFNEIPTQSMDYCTCQQDELDSQIAAAAEQYQKDDAALRNSATYSTTDRTWFGFTIFPSAMKMTQLSATSNEKALQLFNQYLRVAIFFLVWAWALSCFGTWFMANQTPTMSTLDVIQCLPDTDVPDLDWGWGMDWANQTQYAQLS